jgi:hypothetical protein
MNIALVDVTMEAGPDSRVTKDQHRIEEMKPDRGFTQMKSESLRIDEEIRADRC